MHEIYQILLICFLSDHMLQDIDSRREPSIRSVSIIFYYSHEILISHLHLDSAWLFRKLKTDVPRKCRIGYGKVGRNI